MPYVVNDGLKINYELIGNGEPLVMLHPNGFCMKDWFELGYVTQLENHFQLILIDSRGFGDSDKPHDPTYYQPQLIVSDICAVLDALSIEQTNCFGYSMGGRSAFALMEYHPDRCHSFVIGGAHPYPENKLLHSYTQLLQQGLPKLTAVFESNFGVFPAGVKNNFLKNDLQALWAMNSMPLVDYANALANYQGKVSFIVGDKDPILPYVSRAQQSKLNSSISIIEQQNHMQLFFNSMLITTELCNRIWLLPR